MLAPSAICVVFDCRGMPLTVQTPWGWLLFSYRCPVAASFSVHSCCVPTKLVPTRVTHSSGLQITAAEHCYFVEHKCFDTVPRVTLVPLSGLWVLAFLHFEFSVMFHSQGLQTRCPSGMGGAHWRGSCGCLDVALFDRCTCGICWCCRWLTFSIELDCAVTWTWRPLAFRVEGR